MNHRIAFLLVLSAIGGLGISGVACSSSSGGSFTSDDGGSSDGTTGDGGSHDGALTDSPNTGDTGSSDAGHEAQGNCAPVMGPCDIVLQNCPTGKECVLARATDGGYTTTCANTSVGEVKQKGADCTASASNPCLPGLECYDGHCTPHCCMGDDSVCGQTPMGVQGTCDLNISSGGTPNVPLYMVCTYKSVCKPFKVVPCQAGSACTVEDNLGTADCLGDNGKVEGDSCKYKNDCVDGLGCFGAVDAGACHMYCITPGQTPPFDAGALGPGTGGCNTGKACTGRLDTARFPAWLSICQ